MLTGVPHKLVCFVYFGLLVVFVQRYPTEALDFQWSNLEDTGYILKNQIGSELTYAPKLWWIHQQSKSLLGYHNNFFAPDYLKTTHTVYSYARDNHHSYADGLYVKLPGHVYLRQRVLEVTPTLQSWPLPHQTANYPILQNTYCSPHMGTLENNLIRVFKMFSNLPTIDFIIQWKKYKNNFTSPPQEHLLYHLAATFFTHRIFERSKVNSASGRALDFGSFYAPLTINTLFSTSLTWDTKVSKTFALLSIFLGSWN